MDNIFIERLWRSLKYEAVYLHEMTDGFAPERLIGDWMEFYTTERPHSSLGGWTATNFCKLRIRRKRSMARSRRRKGRCEFSARLFSQRPVSCRSALPMTFIAAPWLQMFTTSVLTLK